MDKQIKQMNEYMESFFKGMADGMTDSKRYFLCRQCKHKEVCKKIDEPEARCEHFLDSATHKAYASIYSMFQPVFDWLAFHYPAGGVKFIVDQTSAKMYQEHGPAAFSKEITDVCRCTRTDPSGDEDAEA